MSFLKQKKGTPRVLFITSEAAPFVKAGGLGEVMFSLPRALRMLGYDARLMLPLYAGVNKNDYVLEMEYEGLSVPTDSTEENQPDRLLCNVKKFISSNDSEDAPVFTYFLENEEYYEKRANVYGYADDAVRWVLLSRGTLEYFRNSSDWIPDVIVSSDWQTGFVPNYLRTTYKDDPRLNKIASLFSIHNLYYQGMFNHHFVNEMDFDDGQSPIPSFFNPRLLKINMMRRGIMYADVINTVSENYAKEILTSQYGELLDDLLKERRPRIYGVLNGLDYETINPEADTFLVKIYNKSHLDDRVFNKIELQKRFGLPPDGKKFVLSIVSRFDEQKGFDLLFSVIDSVLKELRFQLVVLGSGDARYMGFFKGLEERFPRQVATHLTFDTELPHIIRGGSDAVLIPSKFEPSGLTQMEAMRYGAVPIVRRTGGLADTVEDYNPDTNEGTGFVFDEFDSLAMTITITRALENYGHKRVWAGIQKRGMEKDFSWENSAKKYADLFKKALEFRRREREELK